MLSDLPLGKATIERELRETQVTISIPGSDVPPIKTTVGAMERAASLVNPRHLPSPSHIKAAADRAQRGKPGGSAGGSSPPPGAGGSPPTSPAPAAASAGSSEVLDIPPFLQRGNPQCIVPGMPTW